MEEYFEILEKLASAAQFYDRKFDTAKEFITNVFISCNIDTDRINNVYLDEVVKRPWVIGFLLEDGVYKSYTTNDRGEIFMSEYADPKSFIIGFYFNSRDYCKDRDYEENYRNKTDNNWPKTD